MRVCLLLPAVALLALAACSGTDSQTDMVFDPPAGDPGDANGGGDPNGAVTFAVVQEQVLNPSCAFSGCHGDVAYPNLSPAQAYAGLVNAPSSAAFPQVTPGDPDASYLMTKITGGPGIKGALMPLGAAPLSASQIALVRAWIEAGAPRE